ncbi:hypothetical protein ACFWIQ_18545 [Kitasatospora sp. NPDC127059]|uniref:hypothetical protein n=1 Tax=unclassified Kitasatospora TaxID=2633591 RepID=UPI0036528B13
MSAFGPEVGTLAVGDRVAWFYHPGSYAEVVAIPAASLVRAPDEVDDKTAAGLPKKYQRGRRTLIRTYSASAHVTQPALTEQAIVDAQHLLNVTLPSSLLNQYSPSRLARRGTSTTAPPSASPPMARPGPNCPAPEVH